MANLSEDIQCAGSDTRPPMLDKTDFASWQQRIRLYCRDPLAPMDDNRTMAQLLEAPTAGYEDAIVVPEITCGQTLSLATVCLTCSKLSNSSDMTKKILHATSDISTRSLLR
ncbi:hypothetical protein Tco_0669597 [Tanacetum coccineum]